MTKRAGKKLQAVATLAILSLITGCGSDYTLKLKNGGELLIKQKNAGCGELSGGVILCYYGGIIKMPSGAVVDDSAEFNCIYEGGIGDPRGDLSHTYRRGYDEVCHLFEKWGLIQPKGTIM